MEVTQMITRKSHKILAFAGFVGVLADAALADILPSPFSFSFCTPGLTELFLWPLSLAGCA
jgi:hypothetical protein